MAATVTRSPAEMVTEADEIVRKAREVAWPESREAQNAIGHEFACAAETRRVYDALVNEEMDPLHALAPDMGWWDDPQQCAVEYAADQYSPPRRDSVMSETTVDLSKLRTPFPPEYVGKLPRVTCRACSEGRCGDHQKSKCDECGNYISTRHIHLDYVGHADVTIRLLEVDSEWSWAPKATDVDPELLKAAMASGDAEIVRAVIENAPPKFETDRNGSPVGLWIKLTVGGVTRLGVGSCPCGQNDAEKVLIGDALRNAALRFGVATEPVGQGRPGRPDGRERDRIGRAGQPARQRAVCSRRVRERRPGRAAPERQRPAARAGIAPGTAAGCRARGRRGHRH